MVSRVSDKIIQALLTTSHDKTIGIKQRHSYNLKQKGVVSLKVFTHRVMASSEVQVVPLLLSEEQKNAIDAFFAHNNWEVMTANEEQVHDYLHGRDEAGANTQEDEGALIPADETSEQCPHCFCSPCVVDEQNRQMWWPQTPSDPHSTNSGKINSSINS